MLDLLLATLLILALPIRALLKSPARTKIERPRRERYKLTIVLVTILLALLTVDWAITGRSVRDLGLGLPLTLAAWAGLAVVGALLVTLGVLIRRASAPTGATLEQPRWELMPDTPTERSLFVGLSIAVGCGWELLYRGFLLFYLPPITGLPIAIGLSAASYGLAHGFESLKACALSIAVALAFAGSYVFTGSLWWLMLLHTGLPLLGLLQKRDQDPAG